MLLQRLLMIITLIEFPTTSINHPASIILSFPLQTPLYFVDNFIMEKDFECIKIKDGLYIGNKIVAMDLEFLLINKFSYVINCASEAPNLFEAQGIRYLKFKIHQGGNQKIFDGQLKRLKKMKKIVEEAEENGMCCLVHCNNGYCRSLTVLTAFLMDRFKWKLIKTVDFLQSKGVSMMFTESNIQELKDLELMLSQEQKLSSAWGPPYVDQEEELITKTYINTSKKEPVKNIGKEKALKRDFFEEEVVVEKAAKRVQWQDRIQKEMKKEKQRLLAERTKEEKRENERSRGKIQEEMMKDSKAHNLILPKDKSDLGKKMKKKHEIQLDPEIKKKIQEAEIMKLIKKSGKLKKELIVQEIDQPQERLKGKQPSLQNLPSNKQQLQQDNEAQEKKVYKLTINNYINPSINIIKPPLDKKKKPAKPATKKEKDKFNRTYSEKETFKKATFYEKEISKDKEGREKEKRNTGYTPVRSRKERKSQKEKDLKAV